MQIADHNSMGSTQPTAAQECTDKLQTNNSNMMEIPLHKRNEDLATDSVVRNGDSLADSPFAEDPMDDDGMRPNKKQKQDVASEDVPHASTASGTTSRSVEAADGSIKLTPVHGPVPISNDEVDDGNDIHPSIAEIIKLEDIPAVEPLEYITIREIAGKSTSPFCLFSRIFVYAG